MRALPLRRPEIWFLASLLVLALTIGMRTLRSQQALSSPAVSEIAPAPLVLGEERTITALQERIRQNPDDTDAYAQLGLSYLLRVRETADPSLYPRAEQALNEAIRRNPKHIDALIGQGSLALSRHLFADALRWGEQARAVNPFRPQVYGVIADALVEMGRYDEAIAAVDEMNSRRPELASYTRASYMLELHGDIPGAIKTMELALSAGGGANESTLWTQVQLGNLYFNSGNLRQAEAQYMQALALQPDYVYAAAGLAKVRAATGNRDQAIAIYKNVTERLPLPEFVVALGELYEVTGKQDLARQQYDLVRAMQQLNAGAGMNVDLELSLFEADHGGDPATTVERAQTAYRSRPSIYGADALAWALYRAGRYDEAWRYAQESLRLGTHDANLHFHAGMIALKLGQNADAKRLLGEALAINPNFSVRHAPEARQALLGLK